MAHHGRRGLSTEAAPRPTSARPPDAYRLLRDAIVSGRLQPNQRLIEADLAQSLGVGRAAIRTALVRLEQESLVERERNRGARVRMISLPRAIEILQAREVLEGLTARRAAEHITAKDAAVLRADLAAQRKQLDRGDLLAASDANAAFHRRIVTIARHETAERLISSLHAQMVRFQYRTILAPGRSESSFAEHLAIADAIADGNARAAERAMRRHIANVSAALQSSISNGGGNVG
ncbi:MAG TPA: GntR family transcriptional regulator [Gaiellaceae bacterium]|nr:GntR family transcriptional regulator [Gaiellaceae bacterium]